ncbi:MULTISPECIES: hypothetical protein [Rhodococcus]|uniref:hypothetical protein n=1 Tax=Rhodococcus TaxID=1827 RepID=UPI00193C3A08|nr:MULTISPECIES: hypothetical protein [Rhodococcus]QRI75035.1 hypothetical protein JQ505_21145 [Rhodococcus aetherivorans]QSE58444.1 hypothetical protein JYA75_22250 [Rhodococcus sp. PSBB066]QSE70235.1 hypothetical protein JYA91_05380 [Rhodococcus sp. PSBB049]
MLTTVRQFVARQLRSEQRPGNIPNGLNIDLTAEMMVRISMVLGDVVDIDDEQLAALARQFIVPRFERDYE